MSTLNYRIEGSDLRYVELTLAPGETAVREPGAMMYADEGLVLETQMGDATAELIAGLEQLAKRLSCDCRPRALDWKAAQSAAKEWKAAQ